MNPSCTSPPDTALDLQCHPASPWSPPFTLQAWVDATVATAGSEPVPGVQLAYRVSGPLAELQLPEQTVPGPADGLWQHTCLEAFVSAPGESAYREFNFSPSGQWAVYRFQAERQREAASSHWPAAPVTGIQVRCNQQAGVFHLQAWVPAALLPLPGADGGLLWGLTAVLEHRDGRLSYWALAHPQPQPDFHHPAGRRQALHLPHLPSP